MPRLLRGFIAVLSAIVPAESRRDFRHEWNAELAAAWIDRRPGPAGAGRAAARALGAIPDAWCLFRQPWSVDMLRHDVRYAVRLLGRHRALTVAATVTLALAIGANAAVFSVLEAVMLRPIAARDPARLVVAWQTALNGTRLQAVFSYPDYRDWRAVAHAVEATAVVNWSSATVTGAGDAERLQAAAVSAGFFETLGVLPQGRSFTAEDEAAGAERVAIVSDAFRRRHLAAAGQPLGVIVLINGAPRRIVGLLAADPLDGVFGPASDLWLPIQQRPQLEGRGNRNFTAIARLARGASPADAERELGAVMARLAVEYPATSAGRGARVITLQEQMSGGSRQGLGLAAAAAALLLLVACANVAGMMVARGLARRPEFATRAALGATRFRLMRQLAIEALALAVLGAAAGIALFSVTAPAIVALLPASTPRAELIGWHPRLALFGALAACVTATLASLPAAWRAGRGGAGARYTPGHGGRSLLAALQVATACVLLIVAGLLAASLARLQRVDAGFQADRMLTLQVQLRGAAYDTPAKTVAFVERLLARVDAMPSVQRAAVLDPAPFSGHINRWDTTSDAGAEVFKSDRYLATASVFEVLGVRATRGRLFEPQDAAGGGVVVDELFASRAFPGLDPIGRTFRLDRNPPRSVVGIVPHIKHYGLDEDPRHQVYVPFASDPSDWLNLLVASRGDAAASIADLRAAIRATDPDIPPYDAATLPALVRRSFGDRRLASALASALGVITLIVAAAGLYGTLDFLVSRRVREIGVRLALGARPAGVLRMILGSALRVVAIGALLGAAAAVAATRAIAALLYDTRPFDPRVYAAVIVTLGVVTFAAAIIPARRAARIDPVSAIRRE
jgi:putative ABC transport system permease protein